MSASTITRGTLQHRLLVALAGLGRSARERELWENIEGIAARWTPDQLSEALSDLRYANLVERKYDYGTSEFADMPDDERYRYRITWQGVEALRRLDAEPVTQPAAPARDPWLFQRCAFSRFTFLAACMAWFAVGVAWGLIMGGAK